MHKRILLGAAGLLAASQAQAQKHIRYELELWPEAQVEYALQSGNYAFVGLRGQRTTNAAIPNPDGFYGKQLQVGYEHFWSAQWSIGGTARYQREEGTGALTPEILLRHRGKLGSFTLGQRLSAEYRITDVGQSRASTRLRVDLERAFQIGRTIRIRPRLAYEAAAYLRLQRAEDEPKERFIDFGLARAEVGLRFTDWLDLTPWAGYSTSYQLVLGQTDEEGNPIPGGPRNFRRPVVGADLRFTLFQGGRVFERRQLPTQH
ncbi:hypothetical protein LRS06_12805 [Hymenobacter sp. J193]|uniref:hypothetical protein n=1 Tax=Hymenobacter sp. J193 TaxID=2898429 RepID=UPI0021514364|nr:hypothetical protein [Hymenobacter sp. J193]MCR5888628.1 hypothetical protein [Hymenobacter sp. J193]